MEWNNCGAYVKDASLNLAHNTSPSDFFLSLYILVSSKSKI